jgi:hypothetical protein
MAVALETEPTFRPGKPKWLFTGKYVSLNPIDLGYENAPWDISPDGKRFLMMKEAQTAASTSEGLRKINVVLNWFEELKQRVSSN